MPSGPKNQKYMNRHAAEAMSREADKKASQEAARKKAAEDAYWEDDGDKATKKKMERQAEKEAKAAAKAERKEENKALYEQTTKSAKKGGAMAEFRRLQAEISKAAVEELEERRKSEQEQQNNKNVNIDKSILNRKRNGDDDSDDDGVEQVNISISSKDNAAANAQVLEDILKGVDPTSDEFRRKMGKRAKVLYKQFCEDNAKAVREANPSLRRTQLNDVMWDMWQQNPQNPFVQRKVALKAERLETHRKWMENEGDESEEEEKE